LIVEEFRMMYVKSSAAVDGSAIKIMLGVCEINQQMTTPFQQGKAFKNMTECGS
jgi:hypothetical protein